MQNTKYLTVLGVISCIAVIYLHVNGCFWTFGTDARWIGANVIECLFYFAVPVFFMISGANLIDYRSRYDTKTYVKKRVFKTLIPFLVWSLIWCLARLIDGQYKDTDFVFYKFFIEGIIHTKFSPNYWFFIPLFVCYACIVLLSLIPEEHRQKTFLFLIFAGLVTISFLPFLFSLLKLDYNSNLQFPISGGGYLLFVLSGYYINKYEIKSGYRIAIYCLGVAGLLAHLLGTHFASFHAGEVVTTYKGYLNLPSVLYSTAIFTLFRYVKKGKAFEVVYKVCKLMAPMTLGIYLIHGLILECIIYRLPFDASNIFFRLFGSLGVFLLSAAIVWCIQRIPVVRKIVP